MPLILAATLSLLVPAQTPRTWEVDGTKREALVYAPTRPAEDKSPHPLVFDFHGHGGTMRNAARVHRIHEVWPEAVVVYPQGLPTPGQLSDPEGKRAGWQGRPGAQGDRDLKFFDAMLATLRKEQPIDEKQVFVTGHSNGGGFTYLLWAARGDRIAAIAPVAAASGPNLAAAGPMPVLHVGSKDDPLVRFAMQQRTIDRVKRINECDEKGEPWGKTGERFSSKTGRPFVLYLYDGGHQYPAAAPAVIARFFREVAAKPTETSKPNP